MKYEDRQTALPLESSQWESVDMEELEVGVLLHIMSNESLWICVWTGTETGKSNINHSLLKAIKQWFKYSSGN